MCEFCEIRAKSVSLYPQLVRLVRVVRLLIDSHIKKQKCKRIYQVSHFHTV